MPYPPPTPVDLATVRTRARPAGGGASTSRDAGKPPTRSGSDAEVAGMDVRQAEKGKRGGGGGEGGEGEDAAIHHPSPPRLSPPTGLRHCVCLGVTPVRHTAMASPTDLSCESPTQHSTSQRCRCASSHTDGSRGRQTSADPAEAAMAAAAGGATVPPGPAGRPRATARGWGMAGHWSWRCRAAPPPLLPPPSPPPRSPPPQPLLSPRASC